MTPREDTSNGVLLRLETRLDNKSTEVRRQAVVELAGLDNQAPLELIMRALGDDDWRVRKEAAAVATANVSRAEVVDALVEAIAQESDIGLKNAAAEALTQAGETTVPHIISKFDELDAGGRKIVIEVVGKSTSPRALDFLLSCASDPDDNVSLTALECLGDQSGPEVRLALMAGLEVDNPLHRLISLQSLVRMRAAIPMRLLEPLAGRALFGDDVLVALGRSTDPAAAAHCTRSITASPAAAIALELLHETSDSCARAVEAALGQVGDPELDALVEYTCSDDMSVKRAALRSLVWSRRGDRIGTVISLAQDDTLHRQILLELGRWGGEALRAVLEKARHLEGRELASALGLLARLLEGDDARRHIPFFVRYLDSADESVATAAAGALARFGDARATDRLLALAGSTDSRLRRIAGYALVELGRRQPDILRERIKSVELKGPQGMQLIRVFETVGRTEDLPWLVTAMSDPDPALRQQVVANIAAVAGDDAVETVALAMTDEDLNVRVAAAEALGRIGPAASEAIVSALNGATGPLEAELIRALGRAGHPEAPRLLRSAYQGQPDVAIAALEAMNALGVDFSDIRAELLVHPDAEVVKRALETLDDVVPVGELTGLLGHPSWDIRLAVVNRLGRFVDRPEVFERLSQRALVEQDDLVRDALDQLLLLSKEGGGR